MIFAIYFAYDSITDGTILPELEPTDFSVQADLNVWFWDALLALQKFNNEQSEVIVSEDAPDTPKIGDLWYDTTTLDMSVWYADDDSAQWVPISTAYNYDADLDVVRRMIADETFVRERALDQMRQQIANFDIADNAALLKLTQDLETLGAAIRREIPDVTPYATTVNVNALAIELRRYKVNYLKEMSFEIFYRNQVAGTGRLDFFINDSKLPNVIIETKSVDKLSDSARSQITSYLLSAPKNNDERLKNTVFGILINWPGAVLDTERNFLLSNKQPEVEFFLREGKEVKQIAVYQ